MGVPDELLWLLHQMRSTASPIDRLKLLARGWRSVRDLSADDRRRLAHELGFDGAEQLIDQLAQRGGMSPAGLLNVLHRAEQADPAVVLGNIRDLIHPERRREVAGEVLDAVSDMLVEHAPEAPGPAALDGTVAGAAPPPPASPLEETVVRSGPVPETEPAAVGPPRVRASAEPTAPSDRRELRSDVAGRRPPPMSAVAEEAREGRPDRQTELVAELSAESSLIRRLRRLAAAVGGLEDAGTDTLARVLECFPAGWARRRALQRVLEAGAPPSVAGAVRLIGMLERPSERLWAITSLAASRPLDGDELETLLAAVRSPALRQRLARRFSRR